MPHILVVEDDAEVREVVCEFLRDGGHLVSSAGSARQARELLAREAVDLLIIDCVMSGEQGGSLAEHAATLRVPAILTSGDPRYRDLLPKFSAPFLTKPFRLRELGELVTQMLALPPP